MALRVTSPFFGLELDGDVEEFGPNDLAWQSRLKRVAERHRESDNLAFPDSRHKFLKIFEHHTRLSGVYHYRLALVHPQDPNHYTSYIPLFTVDHQLSPHAALDKVETELFGHPHYDTIQCPLD